MIIALMQKETRQRRIRGLEGEDYVQFRVFKVKFLPEQSDRCPSIATDVFSITYVMFDVIGTLLLALAIEYFASESLVIVRCSFVDQGRRRRSRESRTRQSEVLHEPA